MSNQAINFAPRAAVSTELYKMEFTLLKFDETMFYEDTRTHKFVPGKTAIDQIAEAAGVSFVGENCTVSAEERDDKILGARTVFVGRAQGNVRMTDGSIRTSSVCEYEFDPVGRVYEDFKVWNGNKKVSADPWDENNKIEVDKQIIQNMKVARQRANTGARLRVIRELIGMPNGFTKAELDMSMRFGRVIQNTDYILQTPEGRILASCQALGLDAGSVFGAFMQAKNSQPVVIQQRLAEPPVGARVIEDEPEIVPEPAITEPEIMPEPLQQGVPEVKKTEPTESDLELEQLLINYQTTLNINTVAGTNPYKQGHDLLDREHTLQEAQEMIEKIKTYLKRRGIAA